MEYKFPISGRTWKRDIGTMLLPERFTPEVIAGYKKNPKVWASQYQQRPSPSEGFIFPAAKWRFYGKTPEIAVQVLSVDCAFKDRPDNDLVALHVYGADGGNRFLLDRRADHLSYQGTKDAIRELREKWPLISYVLIEDKANGPAVVSELSLEMPGIIAINPDGGKESRAHAAAADVYSGNVYVPDPEIYQWVQKFLDIFSAYNGEGSVEFDDDIDAFTQFINWARQIFSGTGTWLDGEYKRVQKAQDLAADTERCPACKEQVSYMSGVWVCTSNKCRGARGVDAGLTKSVTRVGF